MLRLQVLVLVGLNMESIQSTKLALDLIVTVHSGTCVLHSPEVPIG